MWAHLIVGEIFGLAHYTFCSCCWADPRRRLSDVGAWFLAFWLVNTLYFKLPEESGLLKRFGDEYAVYRAHVPMWIPRLKPWQPGEPSEPGG